MENKPRIEENQGQKTERIDPILNKTGEPNTEEPNTEESNTEEPNTEESNTEEPNTEEPKVQEQNHQIPTAEEPIYRPSIPVKKPGYDKEESHQEPQESQEPRESQQPQEPPAEPQVEPDINMLAKKEKALRSKILNYPKQCKKKNNTNSDIPKYTERVQLKTPLTDNERRISELLLEQSANFPVHLYFRPLIESADLSIGTISSENFEDCGEEDIAEIAQATTTKEIIETKYKYAEKLTLANYLNSKKREPKSNNHYLQTLVTSHLQLLESIEYLQTAQIIHFNIHPDIILYDPNNATPMITDFRMAFTEQDMDDKEKFTELFPLFENKFWAPEIHEIARIVEEPPVEEQEEEEFPVQEPQEKNDHQNQMQGGESIEALKATCKSWDIFAVNQMIIELTKHITDIPFMTKYISICSQHPAKPDIKKSIEEIFQSIPRSEYESFLTQMYKSIFIPKNQEEGEPSDKFEETPVMDDTNLGI
jgi:hypothetical protein